MKTKSQYDHTKVEKKWQAEWAKAKLYTPDLKTSENNFYNLWMFPYPSAEGLHAGHAFASTGSDAQGRFQRMNNKTVFQPIGYDSFGIHSENYAIKINQKPQEVVERTTKHYEEQMRSLGHGYDWSRTVATSSPDYYKWTQWLFLKMWEKGLAYKKNASVNFCPSCKTVLADEQVMTPKQAGKEAKNAKGEIVEPSSEGYEELKVCERCGTIVEKKDLDQWFFKITDYADRLLSGLEKIDWSEKVSIAQRNWIGKSEGMIINFKKENGEKLPVFTTRPDTLNAVTFIVVADEELYNQKSTEKLGEFTGEYVLDPLSNRKLPIWKTNYVTPGYGTGNVMGVPAHDERDMDFTKKYQLDVINKEPDQKLWQEIEDKGFGKKHTNYHLRDWLVSRQRYWGAPIPMITCPKCGWVPVPEKDLPVMLPDIQDYKPEGTGKGPLANHKEFYEVKCPKCGGEAQRETDVMDTFVDSAWYFLRYPSVGYDDTAFDTDITKKWLPVNLYFGGAEHSVLHLMYARFVNMVLFDLKLLDFEEPFPKFYAHGLMIKDGAKMSKSRGNVVNPDDYIEKFGADTLRLYLMFMGPMDGSPDFRDTGIEGMQRFVNRIWDTFNLEIGKDSESQEILSIMHQTIKKATKDIQEFKYNTAISAIMQYVNALRENPKFVSKDHLKVLAQLIAPFAPHLAEEAWVTILGEEFSVHTSKWPEFDTKLTTKKQIDMVIQVNGRMRSVLQIDNEKAKIQAEVEGLANQDEKVIKWLDGKPVKRAIFVPGKLLNLVIG